LRLSSTIYIIMLSGFLFGCSSNNKASYQSSEEDGVRIIVDLNTGAFKQYYARDHGKTLENTMAVYERDGFYFDKTLKISSPLNKNAAEWSDGNISCKSISTSDNVRTAECYLQDVDEHVNFQYKAEIGITEFSYNCLKKSGKCLYKLDGYSGIFGKNSRIPIISDK